jgi:hypothetical protein
LFGHKDATYRWKVYFITFIVAHILLFHCFILLLDDYIEPLKYKIPFLTLPTSHHSLQLGNPVQVRQPLQTFQ